MVGHKSTASAERYSHLSGEETIETEVAILKVSSRLRCEYLPLLAVNLCPRCGSSYISLVSSVTRN